MTNTEIILAVLCVALIAALVTQQYAWQKYLTQVCNDFYWIHIRTLGRWEDSVKQVSNTFLGIEEEQEWE